MNKSLEEKLISILQLEKTPSDVRTALLAMVNQAFIEDKQWQLDLNTFELDSKKLMTGQEWYDRFDEEVKSWGQQYRHRLSDVLGQNEFMGLFWNIYEAAKRASGL